MKRIIFKSATEITGLIRDKKISCVELTKQFLDHIKIHNQTINAISDIRDYNEIITEAREKDQLLNDGINFNEQGLSFENLRIG